MVLWFGKICQMGGLSLGYLMVGEYVRKNNPSLANLAKAKSSDFLKK